MPVRLITELQAVNTLLDIIGESPVNTLENPAVEDASRARVTLSAVSVEVQSRGWSWNTDKGFPLVPTEPDGFLMVPPNTLQVDPVNPDTDLVQRGDKLWDRRNHTYTFSGTIKADIIRFLEWDTLHVLARGYIMVRAGRTFQDRVVGSKELSGFNEKDEIRALVSLRNGNAEAAQYSLGRNDPATQRVLQRHIGAGR